MEDRKEKQNDMTGVTSDITFSTGSMTFNNGDWFNIQPLAPDYVHTFQAQNEEVGRLSWSSGELQFSGKLHESAKVLFELLKNQVDNYIVNKRFGEEITVIKPVK